LVLAILSLASPISAANNYNVNNTTYINVFSDSGIITNFNLDGVDYTFEEGDSFTFMEGLYENVKLVLDKPVSILTSGIVNLTSNVAADDVIRVLNSAAGTNITGFNINGSVNIEGDNATINNSNINSSTRNGVLVTANNVKINNNNITGSALSGVNSSGNNTTITNNKVKSSGNDGITTKGNNNQITNNSVTYSKNDGITTKGNNNQIKSNNVSSSGNNGITSPVRVPGLIPID
jgi:hypothetical protein